MKTIKNKYTNFILTVIAIAMIGLNYNLVFKDSIISKAEAADPIIERLNIMDRKLHKIIALAVRIHDWQD